MKGERILVIAAHPDDEVLGCGGILNRFYKDNIIHVLILGEGSTCRKGNQFNNILQRKQASTEAVKYLTGNSASVEFGMGKCGQFRQQPVEILKDHIESTISSFDPTVVFTHYHNDSNLDHTTVYEYTRIATRPYLKNNIHSVYLYEVPSSSDRGGFRPNCYFKLSELNVAAKTVAMSYFSSEQEHLSRTTEGILTLSQYRGSHIGEKYSESFILENSIR